MVATVTSTRTRTQAEIVIDKFGGAYKAAELLGYDASTVYRWTYSRANGGTDGLIPTPALRHVLRVARERGISITPADLYPTA